MKNKIAIISIALICGILFTACKKNSGQSSNSVIGFWVGKIGMGTNPPSIEYGFLFKTDGTVTVYSSADTAISDRQTATYFVTGATMKANFNFPDPVTMTGTINSGFTRIEGDWFYGVNVFGGHFYMDKK
jgi:hypothetical protein